MTECVHGDPLGRVNQCAPRAASERSGRHLVGDLAGGSGWRLLEDPDGVAEGVADAYIGAIEVLDRLLGEVRDAARLEGLVQTPGVVRQEDEAAHGALV